MTALKTDVTPALALRRASDRVRRRPCASTCTAYMTRRSDLTADEAARWEMRYQIGAMLYACALGPWCAVALLIERRCRCAHASARRSPPAMWRRVPAAPTDGRGYSTCRLRWPAVRPRSRWRSRALPITSAWPSSARCSSLALKQISTNLQRIFVQALVAREREAALAGQFDTALNNMPHGLCMFAADGRLAVMNHRFSEMMNLSDDLVQRGASARDIIAACVSAGSISAASGRMIVSEIENSQARDMITTDPDIARGRVAVVDVPADGRRRHRRAGRGHHRTAQRGSQDQPSGALRRTDRPAQPGQFPRRDRASAGDPARRRSSCRRCCSSTSTSSSRSTTRSAIPAATSCCARSPTGCAPCCARRTSSRASAATNSWCSSRTSSRPRRPPRWPARIVERLSEPYEIDDHHGRDRRQHRHRDDARRRRQRRHAAQERRHGALSRQGRRPRHLSLLPRRDGADGRGAPHPGTRPAQGARQRGVRAVLPAALQSASPGGSRPARRCCAGTIRCAARFPRSSSFRSPRRWA